MTTKDICKHLRISSRTLDRRKRSYHPFPEPDLSSSGSSNMWYCHKVIEWQKMEVDKFNKGKII
nr:excisionase Xis [Candidatus Arsenophonus triatominarum]